MLKKMSLFLPHFDDELFILPYLRQIEAHIPNGESFFMNVYFVSEDKKNHRKQESFKVLSQITGVKCFFLGDLLGIQDGKVSDYKEIFINYFLQEKEFLQEETHLFCPMFEAGHRDHDALFEMVYALKLKTGREMFTFSAYNGYCKFIPVTVSHLKCGPVQGESQLIRFSLKDGFWCFRQIFFYVSQWKVLIFLFPGLFHLFFIRRSLNILKVSTFNRLVPHPGPRFYDNLLKSKMKQLIGLKQ